ncbi:hypothetical protein KVP02_13455, partial [Halobacterium salinarum]|uniref:hypothetical protein n=1 Tax=Halobacterium salinarum TaxID=2242 RepID=UPI001F19AD00
LTLLGAERLQRSLEEEKEVSFQRWDEVAEYYRQKEWSKKEVRKFSRLAKDFVERGSTSISEAYFLLSNGEYNRDHILAELDRFPYDKEAKGQAREGFQYERMDDGSIVGQYIEADIKTDLSWSGELIEMVSERSVGLEIDPNTHLLIVKSTSIIDVQKVRSIFSKKIDLEISPLSQLAKENLDQRVDSFFEEIGSSKERDLVRIDSITPRQEDPKSEIRKIELKGDDVYQSLPVKEKLESGCVIQNATGLVRYDDETFKIKIGLSERMSYTKIEDIQTYIKGKKLMNELRKIFINNFN